MDQNPHSGRQTTWIRIPTQVDYMDQNPHSGRQDYMDQNPHSGRQTTWIRMPMQVDRLHIWIRIPTYQDLKVLNVPSEPPA